MFLSQYSFIQQYKLAITSPVTVTTTHMGIFKNSHSQKISPIPIHSYVKGLFISISMGIPRDSRDPWDFLLVAHLSFKGAVGGWVEEIVHWTQPIEINIPAIEY